MELIYIISGLVSLIVLICFFVLVSNVSDIKKRLCNPEYFHQRFVFLVSVGEKDAAKKLLIEFISKDDHYLPIGFNRKEYINYIPGFKAKYGRYMDLVGLSIEEKKVVEIMEYFDKEIDKAKQ